jgi:hypothetical protein
MLAERRDEGEREERRDREAHRSGEQVPVSRGDRVREAASPQAIHPGQDRRQAAHIQGRPEPQDPQAEGPQRDTVAERERSAGRAGRRQLDGDQRGGAPKDDPRPGQMDDEEPRDGGGRTSRRISRQLLRRRQPRPRGA